MGRTEADIGQGKYCKYAMDKKKFLSMLSPRPASEFYMDNNVRAKVIVSPSSSYFIDYNGVVRFEEKKFKINKKDFMNAIKKLRD